MPIRMRRPDKALDETQVTEASGLSWSLSDDPAACYTDRKPRSRILCGSVSLIIVRAETVGQYPFSGSGVVSSPGECGICESR